MRKIKISEATPLQLDWLVAECEGHTPTFDRRRVHNNSGHWFTPTTAWVQGGPIIERERIQVRPLRGSEWNAFAGQFGGDGSGPTPLIAAMRCYVASKLGVEVEIPKELL